MHEAGASLVSWYYNSMYHEVYESDVRAIVTPLADTDISQNLSHKASVVTRTKTFEQEHVFDADLA